MILSLPARVPRRAWRAQRRTDHRLAHDGAGVDRARGLRVLVHQVGEEFAVERAPVGADAHGLPVPDRLLDDVVENWVSFFSLKPTLPGLIRYLASASAQAGWSDRSLCRCSGSRRRADVDADPVQALADLRHGGGGLVAVDGDAHQLRARAGELRDLRHRAVDVGRVGVGHGLHDDRRAAAHRDGALALAHRDADRAVARGGAGDLRAETGEGATGEEVLAVAAGFHDVRFLRLPPAPPSPPRGQEGGRGDRFGRSGAAWRED